MIPSRHADWGPYLHLFSTPQRVVATRFAIRLFAGWSAVGLATGTVSCLAVWLASGRGFGEWVSAKILGRCGFATFFRLCLAVFMVRPVITLWRVITLGPVITFWSLVMLRSVIALRPISRF